MVIDREHLGWGFVTVVSTAAITILYIANNDPARLPVALHLPGWFGPVPPLRENFGATPLGLVYGSVALAIFIFAALLGWRRSHPNWKVGRIRTWLKAHIWLTILTLPLVALHCGFRGGGPMTVFLLALYELVMVSGFWGLALQNIVPRLMRDALPEEVIFEQIPHIRAQLCLKADAARARLVEMAELAEPAAAGSGGVAVRATKPESELLASVLQFVDHQAMPFLRRPDDSHSQLRRQQSSDDLFRLIGLQVPDAFREPLRQVHEACDEARRLDLQVRLHRWLHGWLLVHAPASLLLVIVTIWHAIAATLLYV